MARARSAHPHGTLIVRCDCTVNAVEGEITFKAESHANSIVSELTWLNCLQVGTRELSKCRHCVFDKYPFLVLRELCAWV
jgi:hypothetical protein